VLDASWARRTSSTSTFIEANPSAGAGAVLDVDTVDTLGDAATRALGEDPDGERLAELARRYLGEPSTPPLDRFLTEVDRALALVRESRPARTPPATEAAR
jgi:hypothetical protein